jgi:prevent-host-death family protein
MSVHVVNVLEAKSRLSQLIRAAEAGDDVIVARNGHPVAKIIPWHLPRAPRVAGAWSAQVSFTSDPVGPDDDVTELFSRG